jgi:lipopolysaccharide transport system permease protein
VGFQSSVVPEKFRLLYALNPMVGIIDGFRWSLLGTKGGIYLPGVAIAVLDVILLVISGIWYFRKTERTFADII